MLGAQGARILGREQRRLAAVMAADVVGYSRHMGRDEAGTLARVKDHLARQLEPALRRNRGRLVKLTGDGALAEFGSAVEALKAAIEFQQAVEEANGAHPEEQRIVFRVGLHLGDIIVDGDDIYGDSVNIAARLEREATPSGIVISGALHDATAGRLDAEFVDLGSLSLKNIDRGVQAYRVTWRSPQGASPGPTIVSRSAGVVAAPLMPQLDKASLAVLPFQNMSGDPSEETLSTGWSRTSSLRCHGSPGSSSSHAIPRSHTRESRSTPAWWDANWESAIWLKAAFEKREAGCVSPDSSSIRRPVARYGPRDMKVQ